MQSARFELHFAICPLLALEPRVAQLHPTASSLNMLEEAYAYLFGYAVVFRVLFRGLAAARQHARN